jgi:hypothetical protein
VSELSKIEGEVAAIGSFEEQLGLACAATAINRNKKSDLRKFLNSRALERRGAPDVKSGSRAVETGREKRGEP